MAENKITELLNVLNFLCWHQQQDPKAMYGGVKIEEALASLQKLMGISEKGFSDLKKISLGKYRELSLCKA